jgi:hypothetical protein
MSQDIIETRVALHRAERAPYTVTGQATSEASTESRENEEGGGVHGLHIAPI